MRMTVRGRVVRILIRAPRIQMGTHIDLLRGERLTSRTYDRFALRSLEAAVRRKTKLPVDRDERGRIIIRRVFVSPCPWRV